MIYWPSHVQCPLAVIKWVAVYLYEVVLALQIDQPIKFSYNIIGGIYVVLKKNIITDDKSVRIHGPLVTLNNDIQNFAQQRKQWTAEAFKYFVCNIIQ